jgi:preprotein translocase subunit SecF
MNFLRFRYLYFALSLLIIIPGVVSLFLFGLRPSIDFVGGSLLEVQFRAPAELTVQHAREMLAETFEVSSVQSSGENQYLIKGRSISNEEKNQVIARLEQLAPVTELRFETVGPSLSRELLRKTIVAVVLVAVLITGYIWRQFRELKYGVSAILAMVHDTLILLGIFSVLGYLYGVEVDVLFVTAVLTTLSLSVHDTIVVYDRVRELRRKHPRVEYETVLNAAVTESLSRSLNTSATLIIMLLALFLLGGATLQWFALALLIGAITGTYSSPFTAVPLLLVWDQVTAWRKRRKAPARTQLS